MKGKNTTFGLNRRDFFNKVLPPTVLTCLACNDVLAGVYQENQQTSQVHKFDKDSGMTVRELFQANFQIFYLPLMRNFEKRFGAQEFRQMLMEAFTEIYSDSMKEVVRDVKEKNIDTFITSFMAANRSIGKSKGIGALERVMSNITTTEIVEKSENVLEMKVTECLIADVYREVNGSEIGYITHCYPDIVLAESFDPKMKLYRTKTLMQGDKYCNHRYVFEG